MKFVSHIEALPWINPQSSNPDVNMFALVILWQGFNGLDVLPFTAEVHVLRKHGSQWQTGVLPAQLLNGFSDIQRIKKTQMSIRKRTDLCLFVCNGALGRKLYYMERV